jgi:ABC-2 type transport system permease protein
MKTKRRTAGGIPKFLMYVVLVVLVNVAGATLFFRVDLTENGMYSLSPASREAVSSLSDPLTIKVFFSDHLPAPYNNIERYLRDLLNEYAIAGNRYFNFEFYKISEDSREETDRNTEIARKYGISPVQIQNVDRDEVKFQKAYMGMVLIQGNTVEKIPTITSTDGLEYQITGKIRKLNHKISALLNLRENVQVVLFLSSSLGVVAPYMNLSGLEELPGRIESVVRSLETENYGKIAFRFVDPSKEAEAEKEAEAHQLLQLHWDAFTDRRGDAVPAGDGWAGLVVRYGDESEAIRLIQVIRVPIFGTRYQLMDSDEVQKSIRAAVENVIHVNEEIGYLVSHGCRELGTGVVLPGQETKGELGNLNQLLAEDYSLRRVDLKKEPIPAGLSSLILAGPREKFNDYELYQIDQFLMQGRNVLLFLDAFEEIMPRNPNQRMMPQQGPVYVPVDTGLEPLLKRYGLVLERAYVLDENCYKQRIPQQFGGGERPIYFAPVIEKKEINPSVEFLKNIKGMIMIKVAPLRMEEAEIQKSGLTPTRLVSSSDQSWEMKGRIDLNPMLLHLPGPDEKRESRVLACMLEGAFPSYFADKPVPEKPEEEKKEPGKSGEETGPAKTENLGAVQSSNMTLKKGKSGRLFLAGTSEILTDSLIDPAGRGPNAQFVLNVIDRFNDREANAIMRSKTQQFNPLEPIPPETRKWIKMFNIAGLPVLVVVAGLGVWFRRASRKRKIQNLFSRVEKGTGI